MPANPRLPRSPGEAPLTRYGSGPYQPDRCAAVTVWRGTQCRCRPGFGPHGLFCRRHGLIAALAERMANPRPM